MDLLLKHCKIIDPSSAYHDTIQDVLIIDGKINLIGSDLSSKTAKIISFPGQYLFPGWLDLGTHTGDPGFEHRDDLRSIGMAAAAGGFVGVACMPNTQPVVHSKSGVLYVRRETANQLVDFLPIGALTKDCKGLEITEMIDMHEAGAVLFSDGLHAVSHSGVLLRALQYVKSFDGVVMHHPFESTLAKDGQLHEGYTSTTLGMLGIPALSEEIMVQRDLSLLAYAASKLHLHCISTVASVEMVRQAKQAGLNVTASVAYLNLIFTDEDVAGFNSDLKVLPPLRSTADKEALLQGLEDGTIDAICSNHLPLEEELKKLEFSYADFGATGLQTLYSGLRTRLNEQQFSPALMAEKLAHGPRRILGLPSISIAEGQTAQLTLCSPDDHWSLDPSTNQSKSRNTPFWRGILKGKVLGVINGQQSMIFEP
ncbi:MAG: dihydroorotase [Saprospiraceae bacterium]